MKKIFAIALALVMVLSMASAFASACTGGFDWTCATSANKCGKATVEVIPYVKANDSCGGWKYVPNTCAGAVNSDEVYFVVKLSVDANPDKEWFDAATFSISAKGLANTKEAATAETAYTFTGKKGNFANVEFTGDNAAKAQVYYLNADMGWTRYDAEDENTAEDKFVKEMFVFNAPKAKLCATIKSENAFEAGVVGNYYVKYVEGADAVKAAAATKATQTYTFDGYVGADVWAKTAPYNTFRAGWTVISVTEKNNKTTVVVEAKNAGKLDDAIMADLADDMVNNELPKVKNGKDEVAAVDGVVNQLIVMDKKAEKELVVYTIVDGKVRTIKNTAECGYDTYDVIKAFFGLEIGTCVDKDLIKANFGWKEKVEHCATWSDKAVAVVDAECVVAIPKTGDASVLAWLF